MTNLLLDIFKRLLNTFGPQYWWPGDTAFEIIVGAILTQNTSWKNVEKAIKNLKELELLIPEKLALIEEKKLALIIKPAGFFNVKAKRLKNFISYLEKNNFDFEKIKGKEDLRSELLKINGIGKETTDSILLYAFNKPYFVVDAYTKKIFDRLGILEEKASYDCFQKLFHEHLPRDVQLYNEYHALIVRLGKENCRKKPFCDSCPIKESCQFGNT